LGPATQEGFEKGKTHIFEYALVPHAGDWCSAQSYRHGAEFNNPLIAHKPGKKAGSLPPRMSFLKLKGKNAVLSAVKACPEGIIVRIYEAEGRNADSVDLELAWPVKEAFEVNLIEKNETPVLFANPSNHLTFALKPFEIKTLKLLL
jgi:alpha-mannosidase